MAAMRRRATKWKTNVSQGAKTEAVKLEGEMEELALRAARLIRLDYAGVDLMRAEDGRTYVVEINSIPGWRGLQETTSISIAESIVDHVLKRCQPVLPGGRNSE